MSSQLQSLDQEEAKVKLQQFKGLFDSDDENQTKKNSKRKKSRSRSQDRSVRDSTRKKSAQKGSKDSDKLDKNDKFAHPNDNYSKSSYKEHGQDNTKENGKDQVSELRRSTRGFERLKQSKKPLDREEYDYIKTLCRKAQNIREAREQQERQARRLQRQLQEKEKNQPNRQPQVKPVEERIQECKKVAEYFYLLYETNWNKFDDCFYILNRRWFDRWKDFVSYDYIIKFLIEQGRKENELSINKILSNNSNPGEISNIQLLMERKDYLQIRSERMHYCNSPLRNGVMLDRDIFLVPEGVWKYLFNKYKGEEIKRYAIYKNQAGIIDRQPYLPMVQICLVLREEAIRFPKWIILPRKSTFLHIKWQLKEVFSWLKEYLDEEIRLWRLHPELKDLDFIEQFNQQLAQKQLPKRMKFPGFSLEKSLDFHIEEYGCFDRFRETLFIEIRKIKTIWLFDLDYKDNKSFDEGAFNFQKHVVIYSTPQQDEQWQTNYSLFYKFHNNTNREYWDNSVLQDDPFEQLKKQVGWRPEEVQQEKQEGKKEKKRKKIEVPDNVSEISDEDDQAKNTETSKKPSMQKEGAQEIGGKQIIVESPRKKDLKQEPTITIKKTEIKKCNQCNKNSQLKDMLPCPKCLKTFYCAESCLQKDLRFHSQECKTISPQKSFEPLPDSSTIKLISEDASDSEYDSSAYDPDEKKQLVIEVKKSKLYSHKKRTKKSGKNSNEESKDLDSSATGKRLQRKDSSNLDFGDLKRMKSEELPFKFESFRSPVVPFYPTKGIKTRSIRDTKVASILVLLSQVKILKEQLNYEQGPLSALTKDILMGLVEKEEEKRDEGFKLETDRIQNIVDLNQPLEILYRTYLKKLQELNTQLNVQFNSKIKQTLICISCGHRQVTENDTQAIELSNESEDFSLKLSVKLKVMYIYEYDQFKKYEINLKPGEYTYMEIISKIKNRVQNDRLPIKQCKKTFILVDLRNDNREYGQYFQNEQMKFIFKPEQTLTTFAYELSRAQKDKVKRYHFIHITKSELDQATGLTKQTYHSFPRLIVYNDQDPLKNLSLKIFRGLRSLLSQTLLSVDPAFLEISENDAYSSLFGQGMLSEPYEMVITLKDGSKWKLDPHQNKKLNSIVEPDNIDKFQAIFPLVTNFDVLKQAFQRELEKQMINIKDQGLKDIEACFRKLISVCVIDEETQKEKCPNCKEQKGAQRVVDIMKLGNNMAVQLNKMDQTQLVEIPESMNLDRFMSKSAGSYQTGNDYELVGVIGHEKDNSNVYNAMLRNQKERQYLQFMFGDNGSVEVMNLDVENGRLADELLTFALYTKIEKKGSSGFYNRR